MNFERIVNKLRAEGTVMDRLKKVLRENPSGYFTFDRLADLVNPDNDNQLANALGILVRKGDLSQIYRVVSSNGGGIGDFKDSSEIPPSLFDRRLGREIEVGPENIRLLYFVPASE